MCTTSFFNMRIFCSRQNCNTNHVNITCVTILVGLLTKETQNCNTSHIHMICITILHFFCIKETQTYNTNHVNMTCVTILRSLLLKRRNMIFIDVTIFINTNKIKIFK